MASNTNDIQLRFPGTHRTDVMLEDQVVKVQDAQSSLLDAMIRLEEAENEGDREVCVDQVKTLHKRCSEMVILLRVMVKVRTELGFSKIDLEEARKTGKNVKHCQQRVSWLEERLDKLMMSRRQRGRQRTRKARHTAIGEPAHASEVLRIRTSNTEAATQSFTERKSTGIIPARDPSAALRKAADLLNELRRSRESEESSLSSKPVSGVSLGNITSQESEEETSEGRSSTGSFNVDNDDEEDEGEEETDSDNDEEESSDDDVETDSDSDDWEDTSQTGSEFSTSHASSHPDSIASSEASRTSLPSVRGTSSRHLSAKPQRSSRPASSVKPTVTFMTEPPAALETPASRKTSVKVEEKSTGITLPPIGQFSTAGQRHTQSKDELLQELKRRDREKPIKHAGSPEKALKTPMQFGPTSVMEDEYSWQTIGIAQPYSLVQAAYKRDPVAPFKNASTKYRDPDTEQLQTQKFNALLRKIEEVDVQMQYAGQFSADTKLPPLTLQSMRMSHSNKIALAASCTAARGASSPAPPSRQSVARPEPEERSVDSRASDALSIVESLAESLHLPEEEDDVLDDEEYPDIYWTMLKRNAPTYPQSGDSYLRGKGPTVPAFSLAMAQIHQSGIRPATGKFKKLDDPQRVPTPSLLEKEGLLSVDRNWRDNDRFGAKDRRLKTLLDDSGWLQSSNPVERRSAAKELGELGLHDASIVKALLGKVEDSDFIVCYQASRSLVLLGEWHRSAGDVIAQFIEHGSDEAKLDLLDALLCAHHSTKVLSGEEAATCLDNSLETNLDVENLTTVGVRCAYCLAVMHREKTNAKVIKFLETVVKESKDEADKAQALDTLYKDVKMPGGKLVEYYMKLLLNASIPKHRLLCVSRLGTIAASYSDEMKAYPNLESQLREKLWNDAYKQVSFGAACILKTLGLQTQACKDVPTQLDNAEPTVRLRGVKSMAALRMKSRHNIQVLVDLIRMDPSPDVQRAALKALVQLHVRSGPALRLLQSKAKTQNPLQRDAIRALSDLGVDFPPQQ